MNAGNVVGIMIRMSVEVDPNTMLHISSQLRASDDVLAWVVDSEQ